MRADLAAPPMARRRAGTPAAPAAAFQFGRPPGYCAGAARWDRAGASSGGRNFHASLGRDVSSLARPQMLAPFQLRSYRLQWAADLLTSCAFEMETLILGWYVLVVTNSVLLLTLFGALQFTGTLVAPALGVAGDRIGHRNLLCAMRVFYTILSTTLMT